MDAKIKVFNISIDFLLILLANLSTEGQFFELALERNEDCEAVTEPIVNILDVWKAEVMLFPMVLKLYELTDYK